MKDGVDFTEVRASDVDSLDYGGLSQQTLIILLLGIGPKVTQSVITAAFLFAFKDVLYDLSIKARRKIPAKITL